jgi:putative ABC transport system permease protein
MSWFRLAVSEIWRSPGRFVRLATGVGLLSLLVIVQQAFLSGLVGQMNGGLRTSDADLLVFSRDAAGAFPASAVADSAVGVAASVPGVADAGSLRFGSATAVVGGEQVEVSLVGVDPERPGAPARMVAGRAVGGADDAVATAADRGAGFLPGASVEVLPGGRTLGIVGLAGDANLAIAPTLYVSTTTFLEIARHQRPDALTPPPRTAVAVRVAGGHDLATVRGALTEAIDDVDVLTRAEAAERFPGVAEITHSFAIVLGLLGVVVALVAGLFFMILTVQKTATLTVLRATGVGAPTLVAALVVQVVVVVGTGIVAGAAAAALLLGSVDVGFDAAVAPAGAARSAATMMAMVLVAALAAARRILRVDPATVLT